ncbi:uncharacterized protein KQ657_004459 [Scheffersomyces spartinae]|uniref:Alpha/beta hydrolase n=1 Tax=Scheffersomyces spartinae TaxID=45513 RepID=A0A9P7VBK1_9ASCO|nr:uncharacterized protein KQ657_004459 [Scheffersomyces spartinae]KAG7194778.1 hypothetical protein KQ657_004459 [Scheffersomyces spartinae]
MRTFDYDSNYCSKKTINIGGINVYVYNTESLSEYIANYNKTIEGPHEGHEKFLQLPLNVLYFIHYRGGSYMNTEAFGYRTLQYIHENKGDTKVPAIFVTFDLRNHGERTLDEERNKSWSSGNETHGLDMVSAIEGNIADIKLIMDYLPAYLNLEAQLNDKAKNILETKLEYRNFLSGYSLGGHTVIRFAAKFPELVRTINTVVGCPDLSSLLITRLRKISLNDSAYDKKWFYHEYNELNLTDEEKQKYPEHFHNYLKQQDIDVFEHFKFAKIPMYACFGTEDSLTPPKLSKAWVEIYENTNEYSESFFQKSIGHECTEEMLKGYASWIIKFL